MKILKGAYAGTYLVKKEVVEESNTGFIKSKSGILVEMREIPLDRLERIKDE